MADSNSLPKWYLEVLVAAQQEKERERQRLADIANLNTLSNAPLDPRTAYLNTLSQARPQIVEGEAVQLPEVAGRTDMINLGSGQPVSVYEGEPVNIPQQIVEGETVPYPIVPGGQNMLNLGTGQINAVYEGEPVSITPDGSVAIAGEATNIPAGLLTTDTSKVTLPPVKPKAKPAKKKASKPKVSNTSSDPMGDLIEGMNARQTTYMPQRVANKIYERYL
jgi:hypothetical protein